MPIRGACAASPPLLACPPPLEPRSSCLLRSPPPRFFRRTGKRRHRRALPFPRPSLAPNVCRSPPPSLFPEAAPTPSTCYQQVRVAYSGRHSVHGQSSIGITIVRLPLGSLHTRRDARNEAGARGSPASCSLFRSLSMSTTFDAATDHFLRHEEDGFGGIALRFFFPFPFVRAAGSLTSAIVTHDDGRTSFRLDLQVTTGCGQEIKAGSIELIWYVFPSALLPFRSLPLQIVVVVVVDKYIYIYIRGERICVSNLD